MARVVLESHVARGWFVHVAPETGALELRLSRELGTVLQLRRLVADATALPDGDAADGVFVVEDAHGRVLVAQDTGDERAVFQLTMERGAGRTRARVLCDRAADRAAAPMPGTEGHPWQTGETPFALELAVGEPGVFLGNVPVSADCHALVGVRSSRGGNALLLRATPAGGVVPSPVESPEAERPAAWEAIDPASAGRAENGAARGSVAAAALSNAGSAIWKAAASLLSPRTAPGDGAARAGGRPGAAHGLAAAGPAPVASPGAPGTGAAAGGDHHPPGRPRTGGWGPAAARPETAALQRGAVASASASAAPRRPIADAVRGAIAAAVASRLGAGKAPLPRPPSDPRGSGLEMPLSREQRSAFAADGYVVIPDVVGPEAVGAALRCINSGLGAAVGGAAMFAKPGAAAAGRIQALPGGTGFAHSITAHADVMQLLYRSRAWGAAVSLLGAGESEAPVAAQVALRFPQAPGVESVWGSRQGPPGAWHIDGMDERRFAPFTLLVGVLLSDSETVDTGQLIVFPGSHRRIARSISLEGDAWVAPEAPGRPPRPSLHGIEPREITGRAGSVVLVHPLLAHTVGINYSPHVRYCAYFRVSRRDHDDARFRLPERPMCLYPGAEE